MSPEEKNFCKLLDVYFDALVRGGTQRQIDKARLALVAEYARTTDWQQVARERTADIAKADAEIERLQLENKALRNLAENLRPGPISEALAGKMDEEYQRAGIELQPTAPDAEALAAVPELRGKHTIVLYFDSDADRDEFVALIHEAKPGMRTVSL